jgi:HPt (histidine-containing phosphotransfer) domain-containing protein
VADIVFDREVLLARAGGDAAMLRQVTGLFLGECPRALAMVRAAFAAGDAAELAKAAHYLKGMTGSLAAPDACAAAARLEGLGRGGDLTDAAQAVAALEAQSRRLAAALAALAEGEPSS